VSDGSIRRATAGKRAIVDLVGKRRWQFIASAFVICAVTSPSRRRPEWVLAVSVAVTVQSSLVPETVKETTALPRDHFGPTTPA
jgi:hypothetical protein